NLLHVEIDEMYRDIIKSVDDPVYADGGIEVLKGNLSANGSIINPNAVINEKLLKHKVQAIGSSSIEDMEERVNDPNLQVSEDNVLVLTNAGPIGAPGMPEAGMIPIPQKLLKQGVRDMLRLSDCSMSGTAFGAVVLHVAPEAAIGGAIGIVNDGDCIVMDVEGRLSD